MLLVKNTKRDGLMSLMRLNKFFTETSGRGMADRRRAVMRPDKSLKEEDIFRNVEKWEEEVRDLERLTGETVLSEGLKKTAIKEIWCGRVEQEVDFREMTSSYEQLRTLVMMYGYRKRTENTKPVDSGGMDIGELAERLKQEI